MRGNFTLPAWSDDGRQIAIAERKNGGRKWEISVITLPPRLVRPR
jgi:Tol biopolymer transport system component